jgi:hypothetical protein
MTRFYGLVFQAIKASIIISSEFPKPQKLPRKWMEAKQIVLIYTIKYGNTTSEKDSQN